MSVSLATVRVARVDVAVRDEITGGINVSVTVEIIVAVEMDTLERKVSNSS